MSVCYHKHVSLKIATPLCFTVLFRPALKVVYAFNSYLKLNVFFPLLFCNQYLKAFLPVKLPRR